MPVCTPHIWMVKLKSSEKNGRHSFHEAMIFLEIQKISIRSTQGTSVFKVCDNSDIFWQKCSYTYRKERPVWRKVWKLRFWLMYMAIGTGATMVLTVKRLHEGKNQVVWVFPNDGPMTTKRCAPHRTTLSWYLVHVFFPWKHMKTTPLRERQKPRPFSMTLTLLFFAIWMLSKRNSWNILIIQRFDSCWHDSHFRWVAVFTQPVVAKLSRQGFFFRPIRITQLINRPWTALRRWQGKHWAILLGTSSNS